MTLLQSLPTGKPAAAEGLDAGLCSGLKPNHEVAVQPSKHFGLRMNQGAAHFLRLPLLLTILLALTSARADNGTNQDLTELPLEALMQIQVPEVYSASKFEQKSTEAPASTTVISSDEIKRYGYRTLGDILNSVPGFYITYDRNYDFVGMRGVNLGDFNSRFLLLINGHRINNDLNDGAYVDTAFLLDVDLIDRVEIISGPGSVLYGNNAFFGVINVITRQGDSLNYGEASGAYGSYNAYNGRVTLGRKFKNGLETLWSGSVYGSDGPENLFYPQYNTPAQNGGTAHNLDDDGFGSFFTTTTYKDFTLEGGFINREKGNPTAQYDTIFNNPQLRTIDDRGYATLKYAHKFDIGLDLSGNVYYDRNDFQIEYPGIEGPGTPPLTTDLVKEKQTGEWAGGEFQVDQKIFDRHTLTVGAEYRDDFKQTRNLTDLTTGNVAVDVHDHRYNYGIFAQGDFMIVTNLHINTGVRYDRYDKFDPSITPRFAVIYDPFKETTLKFIYGTAFRDPNFLELSTAGFQDLRPERITSYEVVYEQGIGKYLRSSISGYYDALHNLIDFENGGFVNLDGTTIGTEMALEGHWKYDIRTRLSYSLQHTEVDPTDQSPPDSPMHLVKFNVSAPLYEDKLFAGLEVDYTSGSQTVYTDLAGNTLSGGESPGFTTINLTLFSQNLFKNVDISAGAYNILDKRYDEPSTRFHSENVIPQDGINFRVKLTYRF